MRSLLRLSIITLLVISFSCKNKTEEAQADVSYLVEISKSQFANEKMELGEAVRMPFHELVHFTGKISPSADGAAQVSLPLAGIISRMLCTAGQRVHTGQPLVEVGGNEIIDLQKEFAESAASIKRLKSEFERISALYREKIGTEKEFILAESSYKLEFAKYTALKLKLEKLNLDAAAVEDGHFYSVYTLKAPVSGFITNLHASPGQYMEPQFPVAEIIDTGKLRLVLSIFEKDINKLRPGQSIEFFLSGDKKERHRARLSSIGRAIDKETMAIACYGEIEHPLPENLVSNMMAEGDIITASDTMQALPEDALLRSEHEAYILKLEKETEDAYYFKKIKVDIARIYNGYAEVTGQVSTGRVITAGVYNIPVE